MRYISEKWQQRWGCARRLTNESSLPVGRDRKIQTALRTNQMAGFVTMSSEKNKYIYLHIINMKIYISCIFFKLQRFWKRVGIFIKLWACVLSSPSKSVHHLDTDLEWSSTVGSAMVESNWSHHLPRNQQREYQNETPSSSWSSQS